MELKEYLVTRKKEIKEMEVKPRKIELPFAKNFIFSIVGPRRAGKTFFLYYLIKKFKLKEEDFLFINFEEIYFPKNLFDLPFLHQQIYGKIPTFMFFDEIQALKEWKKLIYFFYEKKKFNIFITGSSSKLLSKEIATQLRGRVIPISVYPLSFPEILEFKEIKFNKTDLLDLYFLSKIKNLIDKHLRIGCFPDIVLENIPPKIFFTQYFDVLIYKDIMERYGIRSRFELEFFLRSLISSFSKEFSINKVFNTLKSQGTKVGKSTLYNFQKVVEDIRFAFFLKKFEQSLRKIELTIPKVYLVDNGFYTFIENKEDIGKLMENFVFLELIKRNLELNKEIFYFKDYQQREIDFVIKENLRVKELIQVSYSSSLDEIEKRELRALVKGFELFKKDRPKLKIITWDLEDRIEFKNRKIELIPLWKFLIEK